MSSIRIYGKKGCIVAVPFQINSVDDDPEVITSEEEPIFNYTASDTDEESNQASAPHE